MHFESKMVSSLLIKNGNNKKTLLLNAFKVSIKILEMWEQ